MTISDSGGYGLFGYYGLSFLCERMTFTRCGDDGVHAYNTKGRLINCVITQCYNSGIVSNVVGMHWLKWRVVRLKLMGM